MRTQVNNAYLGDKMFILDVVTEVHGAKILEMEQARNRVIKYNEENPDSQIFVPELSWWWARKNWPCIPKQLFNAIILELRPLGNVRAKVLVKLCVMGIFIGFIFTVMQALGMNDNDSAFDAVRMLITVVAVIGPSFIAKLQSSEAKAIYLMQKRGLVKDVVEKFLKKNDTFYDYDFEVKLQNESEDDDRAEAWIWK